MASNAETSTVDTGQIPVTFLQLSGESPMSYLRSNAETSNVSSSTNPTKRMKLLEQRLTEPPAHHKQQSPEFHHQPSPAVNGNNGNHAPFHRQNSLLSRESRHDNESAPTSSANSSVASDSDDSKSPPRKDPPAKITTEKNSQHLGSSYDENCIEEDEKEHPSRSFLHDDVIRIYSDEDLAKGCDFYQTTTTTTSSQHHPPTKRKRKAFTKDEDEKITEGHDKFGNEWESIIDWGHLDRTASQIRDRYRRITQGKKKRKEDPKGMKKSDSHQSLLSLCNTHSDHSNDDLTDPASLQRERERLLGWERELRKRDDEFQKRELALKRRDDELKKHEHEFQENKETTEHREQEYHQKVELALRGVLTKHAQLAAIEARNNLLQNNMKLGRLVYERHGSGVVESWQPGSEYLICEGKLNDIMKLKEEIENERKLVKKKYPKNSDEYHEQIEILNIRLLHVKKEENDVLEAQEKLRIRNNLHIKESKRIADEDKSRFHNHPLLKDRYLLLCLLGKGGFSEVYKAYDLKALQEVACKIHSINSQWSEQKKRNYSKHVVREYNIHKSLNHRRVVKLYDVFEIDENSFCTVLEYCDGGDLDIYLKNHPILSEREAKSIITQLFSGLKYLNEQKRPVIHYDLKPGNILFHKGEVKITDFGLSKFYEEDSDGTELTSQGAGTYWYQPPECFEPSEKHPKITCKVDVWAAGVIFYQMLYGKKPFGNGLSQQKFFSEHTLATPPLLEFPAKPVVSEAAKQFIRDCLCFNQDERPDVLTLTNSEYLRSKHK